MPDILLRVSRRRAGSRTISIIGASVFVIGLLVVPLGSRHAVPDLVEIEVRGTADGSSSVALRWAPVDGDATYRVSWTGGAGTEPQVVPIDGPATNATAEVPETETRVDLQVCVVGTGTCSSASVDLARPVMEVRPTAYVGDHAGAVVATWTWPGDASQVPSYEFRRTDASGGGWITVDGPDDPRGDLSNGDALEFAFTGLDAGSYAFGVVAVQRARGPRIVSVAEVHDVSTLNDPGLASLHAGAALPTLEPLPEPVGRRVDVYPPGSGTPFTEVQAALDSFPKDPTADRPGLVVIHGGTYRDQQFTVQRPNMVVQAAPGEVPVFDALASIDDRCGWSPVRGTDTWYCDDLNTTSSTSTQRRSSPWAPIANQTTAEHPEADDPEQLFVGGDAMEQVDATRFSGDRDWYDRLLPGEFLAEEGPSARVYANFGAGIDPSDLGDDIRWSFVQRAAKVLPTGTGARLVGLSFDHYSNYHLDAFGAVTVVADDVMLTDVSITGASAAGFFAGGYNSELTGPINGLALTRVDASGNGGAGAAVGDAGAGSESPPWGSDENDVIVQNSRFDDNNRSRYDYQYCPSRPGGPAGGNCVLAGFKLVRIDRARIAYNSFRDNASHGLWADLFCQGFDISNNFVGGNELAGIFSEVSAGATIDNNVVVGNVASHLNRDVNPSDGPLGWAGAIKVTGGADLAEPGAETVIEHNTLVANGGAHIALGYDLRRVAGAPAWHAGDPNVLYRHNLFVEGSPGGGAGTDATDRYVLATLGGSKPLPISWMGGNASVGNAYFQANADPVGTNRYDWSGDRTIGSIDEFQEVVGIATGDVDQVRTPEPGTPYDPLTVFVDPGMGNFRISGAVGPTWTMIEPPGVTYP